MRTIALIKERKDPPDRRVAMPPLQCKAAMERFPALRIIVESSDIRAISDGKYEHAGVEVKKNVSEADTFIGVKEVPVDALIPGKTYFFFSHTIKAQPYNRHLLQYMIDNNIRMIDHETLTFAGGTRILGFGRYAGLVGAYNGFRAWGIRKKSFNLKPAHDCEDLGEMLSQLSLMELPADLRIVLTGSGRVANGVLEILNESGFVRLQPRQFPEGAVAGHVFTQLEVEDYNLPPEGQSWDKDQFYKDPSDFRPGFQPYLDLTHIYISGHYWDRRAPQLITTADLETGAEHLEVIADISCDINEPIASTIRPSTIDRPNYGFHRFRHEECDLDDPKGIAVMAVDNLPCELPRDASGGFGDVFLEKIIPEIMLDRSEILDRATICRNGSLTPAFNYLQPYADGSSPEENL